MAAGVGAVQYARLPGNRTLMPTQKIGTEFLASSHFTIAQDESVIPGTLKSIFKKDYPPWDINSKPVGAKPPKPSDILQKDDRYFNERASETKQAYEYRHLDKPPLRDIREELGKTNFKMDADPRLNSFQTTHNRDYTPKEGDVITKGKPKNNPMQSFIPQGDPEKAPEPVSDYKDRYRGHEGARPERAGAMHQGGPPTILGDQRQHHFRTTHNDTFRGVRLPKLSAYPAPHGSSIPQGDQDKEVNMITTHQVSFPQHDMYDQGYDKNAVMGKLQGTNFKQNDGHNTWNTYCSTMTDSYRPMDGPIERLQPALSRNHSDFPVGDDNPFNNAQRANMTTNRFYLGNPKPVQRPHIVSGASKRTKSEVWFGEPTQAADFYETTTDSTFKPVSVPYNPVKPDRNSRNAVPLDYYVNEKNNTTYNSDYYDPDTGKMIPNAEAIAKLRESHIKPPLGGQRWFATEHLEQYTPKESTLMRIQDPGRLQRSSVPIGTLNM